MHDATTVPSSLIPKWMSFGISVFEWKIAIITSISISLNTLIVDEMWLILYGKIFVIFVIIVTKRRILFFGPMGDADMQMRSNWNSIREKKNVMEAMSKLSD